MSKRKLRLPQILPYILIVAGIIGYIGTSMLLYDKLQLLNNPHYIPSCNLNPVLSCGSVITSKQGERFSLPTDFIGFGAFTVLAVTGVVLLAGAKLKRWYWLGLEIGSIFGVISVMGLFIESVYFIHALCPVCMTIWVITITTFWYVTLYNIDQGHIRLPKGKSQSVYAWIRRHHLDLLLTWFLIIALLILKHFWYYYGRYF